jgi:hypothetical protein
MADQTSADLTHLAARVAVPGRPAATATAQTTHEQIAAARLAGHAAAGDAGSVRRFVHQLEHGLGPWTVDPWRTIEAMADLALRRQVPAGEVPEAAVTAPAAGAADLVAPAVEG